MASHAGLSSPVHTQPLPFRKSYASQNQSHREQGDRRREHIDKTVGQKEGRNKGRQHRRQSHKENQLERKLHELISEKQDNGGRQHIGGIKTGLPEIVEDKLPDRVQRLLLINHRPGDIPVLNIG